MTIDSMPEVNPYDIHSIHIDTFCEGTYSILHNMYVTNKAGRLIYVDTVEWFTLDDWVKTENIRQIYYLLFPIFNPVSNRNMLVCSFCKELLLAKKYILNGPIIDINEDGVLETVGRDLVNAVCLDCDSAYYNPYEVYRFGNLLERDTILDSIYNKLRYGVYIKKMSFKKDTIVIPNQGDLYYNGKKLPE